MTGSSFPDRPSLRSQIPFTVGEAAVAPYLAFGPTVGAAHPANTRVPTNAVETTTVRTARPNSLANCTLKINIRAGLFRLHIPAVRGRFVSCHQIKKYGAASKLPMTRLIVANRKTRLSIAAFMTTKSADPAELASRQHYVTAACGVLSTELGSNGVRRGRVGLGSLAARKACRRLDRTGRGPQHQSTASRGRRPHCP